MKILVFGAARDIVGESEFEIQINEAKTVQKLRAELLLKYPALKKLNALALAVNEAYANDSTEVTNQDVVALIPPVSGG